MNVFEPEARSPLTPIEAHMIAENHKAAGRLNEAEHVLRQILAIAPQFHPAYHTLGLIAYEVGKLPLAVELIAQAIVINPNIGLYYRNIGEMCRRLGRLDEAVAAGKRAAALTPQELDAHYNLGLALTDQCAWAESITAYHQALALNPQHGLSWNNLGAALEKQGKLDEAEAAYAKAVAINPQHSEAQTNLGALYSEQGRLEDACRCFEAAIEAAPDFIEPHFNLSSLKTYTEHDPHLAMLERNRPKTLSMQGQTKESQAQIRYWFALGKAYEDVARYDEAFAAYEAGNSLQHGLLPCDEARADVMAAEIKAVFTPAFFEKHAHVPASLPSNWLSSDQAPIFIVGMPRSGTTLLEQILSSHPAVHGAGELLDMHEVLMGADGNMSCNEKRFPSVISNLKPQDFARLGAEYVERVWKLAPAAKYITDKMPANFFYLGMIHLMLPNARIIHAMRDPMDSCFSCYSRLFNDTMEFAYDQGTLGRYYVRYMELMRHWHAVLPKGRILDLRYEELVADTEGQARRILDFVGLPWDDNCLAFHQNKRHVKTASVAQVRKPIYKTSVARWQRFEAHLQPLLQLVQATDYANPNTTTFPPSAKPTFTIAPTAEELHLQGVNLYQNGHIEAAVALYRQALALKPDFAIALNSLGYALQDLDKLEEARSCYELALKLAPDYAMARLNLGMLQLKLGNWAEGWEHYEARWIGSVEATAGVYKQIPCDLPLWSSSIDRETDTTKLGLLVICEQGFGDLFMMARYLALATKRFARVGLVCGAPVRRLMEWSFGNSITLVGQIPTDNKHWDRQCPLMSLPHAFATRPDNVPNHTPYLAVPQAEQARWQQRLADASDGRITIGLAWAGRKTHVYDARRSMSLAQLAPLFEDERFVWVSLQKWDKTNVAAPDNERWLDWTNELNDFADSAALITALDYVITIDSAMAHLAGALNKPVWMMNRFDNEWRWLRNREDSVWYPSMRIFRQPAIGDWTSVVANVVTALQALSDQTVKQKTSKKKLAAPTSTMRAKHMPDMQTPAQSALSIDQALEFASQLQAQGRLQESEHWLQQILQAQPDNAFALHLLGIIAHQVGQTGLALSLIEKAIQINNCVALFHANLSEMLRQQKRLDEAIMHGEQAVRLDASTVSAHGNLGVAYFDRKDYALAEACHQRVLEITDQFAPSLNNLGSIERARKNIPAAILWYRKAIMADPSYFEPLNNLGAVLLEEERFEEALLPLNQALNINPKNADALCNQGLIRHHLDDDSTAFELLQQALHFRPDYPEAHSGLARVLQSQEKWEAAEQHALQAIALRPGHADGFSLLGTLYTEMGRDAEAQYQQALALEPEHTDALVGLGNLWMENGDMVRAEHLFQQAVSIDPDNIGARFHLTQVKKVSADDANFAALVQTAKKLQMAEGVDSLPSSKAISLHFALGKCYEDNKSYEQAFPHFIEGCRLKRASFEYDAAQNHQQFIDLMQMFDQSTLDRLRDAGSSLQNSSTTPIFVLGMPRSGTTLTEQIIASHPEVYGAGELPDLMEILQFDVDGKGLGFPYNLANLTPEKIPHLAAEYLARLQQRAPDSRYITDKMPANFYAVGLMHLMLPHAKIIHVNRNPVDTCVSCFTRLFQRKQHSTYDLTELGQHYADYARLMQHWRKVLPTGAFLEVNYEDIVANQEAEARRLIAYCGLEWNDACLSFYNTNRTIRTASLTQVRQPIYTSSVERWRLYKAYLTPLVEALGNLTP